MWLKVGIPVLVLLSVVAVRLVYYVFWRRHWDKRPRGAGPRREEEVVVIGRGYERGGGDKAGR